MHPRHFVFSLLLVGLGALLAACTTPTDGLLAEQGFGHFAANSVNFDLDDPTPPPGELTTQLIDPITTAQAIFVDGLARGIGSDEYLLRMFADGNAVVSCTNNGMNLAPGQQKFSSNSMGNIDLNSGSKGKFPFDVNNGAALSPDAVEEFLNRIPFPCPNEKNWTLSLDWIDWNHIELYLYDPASPPPPLPEDPDDPIDFGNPTDELHYQCTTNRAAETIDCDRLPDDHPPVEPNG